MLVPVIGLGAGGHARVIIEILRQVGEYDLAGLLDLNPDRIGELVMGVPILGNDDLLPRLSEMGINHAFIGLGTVGPSHSRVSLYEKARLAGFQIVMTIHPRAVISPSVSLGAGATVMAMAVINAAARIGVNVIVNTAAIIEHDGIIGDHVHVATGARLCGHVTVGEQAFIGAGSTIRQGITIGPGAIIGAGAVVVRDVPPGVTVVGIPSRILDRRGSGGTT